MKIFILALALLCTSCTFTIHPYEHDPSRPTSISDRYVPLYWGSIDARD